MKRVSFMLDVLIAATVACGLATAVLAQPANSQQVANAQRAAEGIITDLGSQKYKTVWDNDTSEWFKGKLSEDAFLSNMSVGRSQLGIMQKSSLVSSDHSTSDPATGYQGDIYAFTFRDKYPVGEFYERIVVIKDRDGQYRMSGLFGSPVPSQ
jgi:hypothetical protein